MEFWNVMSYFGLVFVFLILLFIVIVIMIYFYEFLILPFREQHEEESYKKFKDRLEKEKGER
jgi:uncharacterized membrane protein